jgi:hypothetical protein
VATVDWVQDVTARWARILTAAGPGETPLGQAARQISETGQPAPAGSTGRFGRPRRDSAAPAESIPATVLSRQLIVGVLVSDFLVSQLCAVTGQAREQVLGQLSANLPLQVRERQLEVLLLELSGGCALLRDPERPTYAALGRRIEQLLKDAEDQAVALIEAARAEAARIVAEAQASPPA